MATTKKLKLITNYRALRNKLNLNQSQFWSRLGVTQSGGSRYESGRKVPKSTAVLAHAVYMAGIELNANNYR